MGCCCGYYACWECYKTNRLNVSLTTNIVSFLLSSIPLAFLIQIYDMTNFTFADKGDFSYTGILMCSNVVCCIFTLIMGIPFFCCYYQSKECAAYFKLLIVPVTLFSTAIEIYLLYVADRSWISKNSVAGIYGIEAPGSMFENFYYFDQLFIDSDYLLCSDECQCYYDGSVPSNINDTKTIKNVIKDKKEGYVSSPECPGWQREFRNNMNGIDYLKKEFGELDPGEFVKYWRRIESKFKCAGWITTTYTKREFDTTKCDDDPEEEYHCKADSCLAADKSLCAHCLPGFYLNKETLKCQENAPESSEEVEFPSNYYKNVNYTIQKSLFDSGKIKFWSKPTPCREKFINWIINRLTAYAVVQFFITASLWYLLYMTFLVCTDYFINDQRNKEARNKERMAEMRNMILDDNASRESRGSMKGKKSNPQGFTTSKVNYNN